MKRIDYIMFESNMKRKWIIGLIKTRTRQKKLDLRKTRWMKAQRTLAIISDSGWFKDQFDNITKIETVHISNTILVLSNL
jgi:hypothetical protein